MTKPIKKRYCLYCAKKLIDIKNDYDSRKFHLVCENIVEKIKSMKLAIKYRKALFKLDNNNNV